jgi:hypothetical protein
MQALTPLMKVAMMIGGLVIAGVSLKSLATKKPQSAEIPPPEDLKNVETLEEKSALLQTGSVHGTPAQPAHPGTSGLVVTGDEKALIDEITGAGEGTEITH